MSTTIDTSNNKNTFLFNKVIDSIIVDKLINLLTVISKNNPDTFKKEYINSELELIKNNLSIIYTIVSKECNKKIKVKKKYYKPIQTNKTTKTNYSKTNYSKKTNSKNNCLARVWSDTIVDKNTLTKVIELDKLFKVKDFNAINNDIFNEKYSLGKQCTKHTYANTNYCKLHLTHLIHGNYKEKPSKELCYHFMKEGKYL